MKITISAYRVVRNLQKNYVVLDGDNQQVGKEYAHSTSAYAALGRIVSKITNESKE